jgi:hypothetical protein
MVGSRYPAAGYAQSSHVTNRFLLVPLAALALAACKDTPGTPSGVISREKFVAANVAVRTVPDTASQAQRDAALKKAGVTDKQLRAWVTAYSRQPDALAEAWEEIAFKVDSIGGATPMQVGGPPPPSPEVLEMPRPRPDFRGDSMRVPPRRRPPPPVQAPGDFNAPPAQ